jgi:hypothetical protein
MTDADRVAEYQAGLAEWRVDSTAALERWAGMVGTHPPTTIENPHLAIEPTQAMLGHEDLESLPEDDRNYVFSHLLALVAAVLRQRRGGDWAVDDDPASETYARYVIDAGGVFYDPGQVVIDYLMTPPGTRDLERHIALAEANPTGPATRP